MPGFIHLTFKGINLFSMPIKFKWMNFDKALMSNKKITLLYIIQEFGNWLTYITTELQNYSKL